MYLEAPGDLIWPLKASLVFISELEKIYMINLNSSFCRRSFLMDVRGNKASYSSTKGVLGCHLLCVVHVDSVICVGIYNSFPNAIFIFPYEPWEQIVFELRDSVNAQLDADRIDSLH